FVPDTSPFSPVTSSRYWMAGLVASGAVMVLYTAANWLLGRFAATYRPPAWWRVWVLCAAPLVIGIPLITMTVNQPTLPALNAGQITLATLIGLVLALMPGKMAAERPRALIWLAADGWGLTLMLYSVSKLELVPRWLAHGSTMWVWMTAAGFVAGVLWLLIMTGLRIWRCTPIPSTPALFTAGLCMAYVLTPLAHHVIGTDGYYYISDMDNFFARSRALQVATWLVAVVMALGVTRLREHLAMIGVKPHTKAM
ncbi:MAG: hypothetical protein ACE5HA_05930, partial [Anaerolineae bacterium]